MSVYVDAAINPFGRMMMCHMIADSTDELYAMVDQIGVARKWIQRKGQLDEHFDICKSKRAEAIQRGAIEIGRLEFVNKLRARRQLPPLTGRVPKALP